MRRSGTPSALSSRDSAAPLSSGVRSIPRMSTKNRPSSKRGARRPAAWIASVVLPIPAVPVTVVTTAVPAAARAAYSCSAPSSSSRPLKSPITRGSSHTPRAGAAGRGRPRAAAASSDSRADPGSASARASASTVRFWGPRLTARSMSLMVRTLTPEALASCSMVSPAARRCARNRWPKDCVWGTVSPWSGVRRKPARAPEASATNGPAGTCSSGWATGLSSSPQARQFLSRPARCPWTPRQGRAQGFSRPGHRKHPLLSTCRSPSHAAPIPSATTPGRSTASGHSSRRSGGRSTRAWWLHQCGIDSR